MSVPVYCIDPEGVLELAKRKIVSMVMVDGMIVVARYGVNKTTLRKLAKKEK